MVGKSLEIYIPMQVSDYKVNKNSRDNVKCNQESGSKQNSRESIPGKKAMILSSIDFSDEDFMVFCLREDEAIHRKLEKPEDGNHTNTESVRPTSRKLMHENTEEKFTQTSHADDHKSDVEEIRNSTTNERESMTCNNKVKAKPTPCVLKNEKTVTRTGKQEEVSAPEASDSHHSDGSFDSLSSPVLRWEGHESPAQMPKLENLSFWKHKLGVLCLCKRF